MDESHAIARQQARVTLRCIEMCETCWIKSAGLCGGIGKLCSCILYTLRVAQADNNKINNEPICLVALLWLCTRWYALFVSSYAVIELQDPDFIAFDLLSVWDVTLPMICVSTTVSRRNMLCLVRSLPDTLPGVFPAFKTKVDCAISKRCTRCDPDAIQLESHTSWHVQYQLQRCR